MWEKSYWGTDPPIDSPTHTGEVKKKEAAMLEPLLYPEIRGLSSATLEGVVRGWEKSRVKKESLGEDLARERAREWLEKFCH